MNADDELARLAKAIAHPIRVKIIRMLRERNACVSTDLTSELGRGNTTVWQHLKILQEAGIVQGEISGPKRCYCLDPAVLTQLSKLIDQLAQPTPHTSACNPHEKE